MDDSLTRFWTDLVGRLTGPMTFRLILQPAMATLYACRDGLKDAREGKPPYFWAIFADPSHRKQLLGEGKNAVGRVIVLGIGMDLVYQLMVLGWVYPVELIVVVLVLAFMPYVLLRGPINRIAQAWKAHQGVHPR